jgi:8-oxo-dGTP pyrophosphatase MutT (NUDIX family)
MKKDTNNKILAIIYSDKNKFLLLKTNPKTMKINGWYVVTGAVKEGESFKEAVKREVEEETKLKILKIKRTKVIYNYEWPIGSGIIKCEKVFLVKVEYDPPKITRWEHLNFRWLSKKDFIKEIYSFKEDKSKLKKLLKDF